MASGVIVAGSMALLTLIFIGIAAGFGLSAWLESYFYGFGIVGIVVLLTTVIIVLNRKKWIEQPIFELINKALRGTNSELQAQNSK